MDEPLIAEAKSEKAALKLAKVAARRPSSFYFWGLAIIDASNGSRKGGERRGAHDASFD
jgi:hypothetical protein